MVTDPPRSIGEVKLRACLARIAANEGIPPFREHAGELIVGTYDLENSSSHLSRIILKDVGLTSQMLQVANSAFYNRSGRPILTVAHAVTLLGWETIRNRVSAVRYIEHFANRSPGLRELMVLSVISAVHSREVAVTVGYPRPEEAFLCALLRNLGEVLIASHFPEEYGDIILAMQSKKLTAQAACVRVLSFHWEAVGARTAAAWNLPPSVQLCLNGAVAAGVAPLDRCLASLAEYGQTMTNALYRKGTGIESMHLGTVIDPHGRGTLVPLRDLQRVAGTAVSETAQMLAALKIPVDVLLLEMQAQLSQANLESGPSLEAAVEVAARELQSGDFQITPYLMRLLDGVQAAGFDLVIFGLVNEDCTVIRGRLISGDFGDNILSRFDFPIDRKEGPISAALRNKLDVLVDGARDDRYNGSGFVKTLNASAFALFPIVVDRKVAGCLYAGKRGRAVGLENFRAGLVRVRDLIAEGIGKTHQG